MQLKDYYAPWEWVPIEYMPDGCNEVEVRDIDGNVSNYCSCDYWWFKKEKKELFTEFRYC